VPTKIKRWDGFSATNQVKARLRLTEHPNATSAWSASARKKLVIDIFTFSKKLTKT
jgi:hypothetical protein